MKDTSAVGIGCGIILAIIFLCYAIYALVLKTALGALHIQIDFWGALAIIVILAIIASFFRSNK